MILVTADVTVPIDQGEEAMRISREHVDRSRREPGCLSHDVLVDPATPGRLVFLERWADRAALDRHFEVDASRRFAAALSALALAPPKIEILPIVERGG